MTTATERKPAGTGTLAKEGERGGRPEIRSALVPLILIALAWIVIQLIVIGFNRYYEWWDESVYVSQVTRGSIPVFWGPHRARGIVWLIKPVASTIGTVQAMRLYLMVVTASGLVVAGSVWSRVVGRRAILGILLFASTWLAIYYGSFASPNLPGALVALGAAGLLAMGVPRLADPRALALLLLVAASCSLRPLDGLTLAATLCLLTFLARSSKPAVWTAAIGGWFLGLVPFYLDARGYGGILNRMKAASKLTENGLAFMVPEHLRLADGPYIGPDPSSDISFMAVAWWVGLITFAWIGIMRERGRDRRPATIAALCGVALSLPYLFYASVSAPRFLTPAYALLSMAAAIGLAGTLRRISQVGYRIAVAAVMLVPLALWHMYVADDVNALQERESAGGYQLGSVLRAEGGGKCAFGSRFGSPVIQMASGCYGVIYKPGGTEQGLNLDVNPALEALLDFKEQGYNVFVLTIEDKIEVEPPIDTWVRRRLNLKDARGWVMYQPREQMRVAP